MKAPRHIHSGCFLDQLTPAMSLNEVGALLGMSDSCAMRMERSAGHKLEEAFRRLRLETINDFVRIDEQKLDARLGCFQHGANEYSERAGWYPLLRARSTNNGTESLRDAVVAVAVLRFLRKSCWAVPLLCRRPDRSQHTPAGVADTVVMLGANAVFRSMDLRRLCRSEGYVACEATAIVESELGEDACGSFEVPLIRAIAVHLR